MRHARLVLVEGLPGSGKSTTAQWLCRLLDALKIPAAWCHEQDVQHPIYRDDELQAATRGGREACEAYHAGARDRWTALVDGARDTERVTILESSFFQSPIASMLLARCGGDAIARHVEETEAILAPLRPLLIVLNQDDPAAAYRHICSRRGPQFEPFLIDMVRATPYGEADGAATPDGIILLLQEHADTLHECARRVTMPGLEVDVTRARWTECRLTVATFLDLPVLDPYLETGEPAPFVGRYRDAGSDQELLVAADERGLFLDPTGTRLLRRSEATFEMEGLPIELTFEASNGSVDRMQCSSRLSDIGPVWVRAT